MTQPQWTSLYIPSGAGREALVQAVATALAAAGGITYDPFGVMPGLSYPRAAKLFAAPPDGTWLRLIPSRETDLAPIVAAAGGFVVVAEISGGLVPSLTVYENGQPVDTLAALSPHAADPAAFAAHLHNPQSGASGVGGISSGALPENVRAMSANLPTRQVERLMNSMTGVLSKGDKASAQAALQTVDWGSGAGAWMRAALVHIGLEHGAALDFATISTAYRTARRLARNPNATLIPGDAEASAAVPDALDYAPVFFGWKA